MSSYRSALFCAAAFTLLACGDDSAVGTGGGGGSGTTSATTSAATTSAATTAASTTAAQTTTTVGSGGAGGEGGADPSPCSDECAADDGCDESPANPDQTGDCAACIQGEVTQATDSPCTVAGATGDCCAELQDCGDFITCLLTSGDQAACATEFPQGAQKAIACILESCGECGDGSIPEGTGGGGGGGVGGGGGAGDGGAGGGTGGAGGAGGN